jgi:hypothetical protein
MGWQNNIFQLLIIEGTSGFSGLFVYSPAPGAGNLIGSWAAALGVDPYGNAYPQGLAIFNHFLTIEDPAKIVFPSGQTLEQTAANIESNFLGGSGAGKYLQMLLSGPQGTSSPAAANDWVQIEFNSSNAGATTDANMQLVYIDITGTPHLYGQMDAAGVATVGGITAGDPTLSPTAAESWKTLALVNGYTAGNNPGGFQDVPQVRLMADNKNLQFKGSLTVPNPQTSAVWSAVPANYPNANLGGNYGELLVANYSAGTLDHIQVQNNGNLSLHNLTSAGITFNISGMMATQ